MSKVRKLISIATIFPMCLTSIYGYAGDATYYGIENSIVAQSPIQPPVVGAVLKSLGDNQFCISSTIGNPDLVPFIFTEPDESHEEDITDIINAFSSMGVTLCTTAETAETEKIIQKEVQYVNTSLVDSEVYSNQKRITLVDRISGVVNNDIKIKTGGLMTAWPFELFHFQVPSFTSTIDEEMAVSMETAIETVQGVYTRVFSNSNEGVSISKRRALIQKFRNSFARCGVAALAGIAFGVGFLMIASTSDSSFSTKKSIVIGALGISVASSGGLLFSYFSITKGLLDFGCVITGAGLPFLLLIYIATHE